MAEGRGKSATKSFRTGNNVRSYSELVGFDMGIRVLGFGRSVVGRGGRPERSNASREREAALCLTT